MTNVQAVVLCVSLAAPALAEAAAAAGFINNRLCV